MDDDKLFDDDAPLKDNQEGSGSAEEDSGLGNLPPLSEFDSQGGFDSDGDLPPLGDFETQDSSVTGSEEKPPAEDAPRDDAADSFPGIAAGAAFESEQPGGGQEDSSGFQDLAADSDFSPETPDIGPGPDSTLDTPIFDSAFGGDDSGFGDDQTSTATQAMDSPMFDDFGADTGFDTPTGGTPMPDMSPDTGFGDMGAPAAAAAPTGEEPPSTDAKAQKRSVNPLVIAALILFALAVGIITSPYFAGSIPFLPNPLLDEIDARERRISDLQAQVSRLQQLQATEEMPVEISEQRVAELQNEILARTQELDSATGQLETIRTQLDAQQRELSIAERELRERNDEVIAAREFLDELRNETAIVQARQRGLMAEVDRLTGYVGELEDANARRVATKEALEHNIDRLVVQVKESIPLTPQKFDHAQRLAAVRALRERAAQVSWVTPELQNEYTTLFLHELELARSNEYFFARVPVTDRYGHRSKKWAECLMRGNWAVYYRTLDGNNIGSYENQGPISTPMWEFREDLPNDLRSSIEAHIISARIPDFESQAQLLAEREMAGKEGTVWQRTYSSL